MPTRRHRNHLSAVNQRQLVIVVSVYHDNYHKCGYHSRQYGHKQRDRLTDRQTVAQPGCGCREHTRGEVWVGVSPPVRGKGLESVPLSRHLEFFRVKMKRFSTTFE